MCVCLLLADSTAESGEGAGAGAARPSGDGFDDDARRRRRPAVPRRVDDGGRRRTGARPLLRRLRTPQSDAQPQRLVGQPQHGRPERRRRRRHRPPRRRHDARRRSVLSLSLSLRNFSVLKLNLAEHLGSGPWPLSFYASTSAPDWL